MRLVWILLVIFSSTLLSGQEKDSFQAIQITITFATSPASIEIEKAPLRYNKKFAVSLQFDDGVKDSYTHGFFLTNGGIINGNTYPGLYYTDGCGNDLNFTMSSSISSFSWYDLEDLHDPYGPYQDICVTWPELVEMYQHGWAISNHGLTSDTGNYAYSIARNHSYVKLKTKDACEYGVDMEIFVNVNGDINFSAPAFEQGYLACYVQGYDFGNPSFDVTSSWNPLNIEMGRSHLYEPISFTEIVNQIDALSINGSHHWGVSFVHSITDPIHGYSFETFKQHMNYIAGTFGKAGLDNIWMASEEEILNYLLVNRKLSINSNLTNNKLVITFSGDIPSSYRFYGTSLNIHADALIDNIEITGTEHYSFTGIGNDSSLINLTWDGKDLIPPSYYAGIWVTKAENSHNQEDANIAIDYILMMPEGEEKDEYKDRVCAIPGLLLPDGFCNLSTNFDSFKEFMLYPNPCNKYFTIHFRGIDEKIQFELYNLDGKSIRKMVLKPKASNILEVVDVSQFPPGIYFVKVSNSTTRKTVILVIR